jgi:protein arginine kinase activator
MTCEICKEREASVHLTQVIDGKVKKMHLCEQCASKSGIDVDGPLSITDILLGMGVPKQAAENAATRVSSSGPERTCPRCHMRRSDFKKGGRFGCAECYETFADELPPLLKQMHRSDRHVGKIPSAQAGKIRAAAELSDLQEGLKKAVAAENFEEAAKLRDRIEALKSRPGAMEARREH